MWFSTLLFCLLSSVSCLLLYLMRVLFTGGSSPLGARVLRCLLASETYTEIWCGVHEHDVQIEHPKLRRISLRLEDEANLDEMPAPLDLVIHFAGVTHARDEERYRDVNLRGTMRLAESARARGCRRFVYASTRCATSGSGAYGESKLAAELELQKLDWDSLLILRPAEIYGGGGREGIDRFIEVAARFHVVPLLFGHEGLQFAPLHMDDSVSAICALLLECRNGTQILEICGPESLSGARLAGRIARRHKALPLPLWWPALALILRALQRVGVNPVTPDQVERITGRKTANSSTPDPALERPMIRFMLD
jgi:nucleoside-diphosphate-sugar epimerase